MGDKKNGGSGIIESIRKRNESNNGYFLYS